MRAKARERPQNYPKLKGYVPSRFMLNDSHYDATKADRAAKVPSLTCSSVGL